MKTLIISLLSITACFAQNSFTVKGGVALNNNEMGSLQVYSPNGKTSFYAGASYLYKPAYLGFEGELQYTSFGSEGYVSGSKAQANINSVNLILTGNYYTTETLAIKVGGYIGAIVGPKFEYDGKSIDYEGLKSFDYGVVVGATYDIYKGLFLDGKVLIGLHDLNDGDIDNGKYKIKNTSYQFGIGYRF